MSDCVHCGTPLEVSQEASGFCCVGCEFVYGLIHDEGLENFYDLKRGETISPLNDQPFQQYDFSWLENEIEACEKASPDARSCELDLSLQGVSCVGCVWLVERLFQRHEGALHCDLSPATGAMRLGWEPGSFKVLDFAQELQKFGYIIGKYRESNSGNEELRRLSHKLGICGAFALNAMVFSLPRYLGMPDDFMFAGIFELITMLSATVAMMVGGSWFILRSVRSLKAGVMHMDTPIALGVSLAYLGSLTGWLLKYENLLYFDFVAIFIFLMLAGRWLQTAAVERNKNRLLEQTPVPQSVVSVPDGIVMELADLKAGDRYTLPAGQTTPVASVLSEGNADFSLEWINGEPDPCHHQTGTHVPAGAIKLSENSISLTADESWQDSMLAKLLREGDSATRSPVMEKVLRIYLTVVLILGIGGGIAWLISGAGITAAMQVSISIFVISCPCALGVALPLADDLVSSRMRSCGVFIRKAAFWSRIRRIKTLFFDKTGTLTLDLPSLTNEGALAELPPEPFRMLATLCGKSRHPLSRALLKSMGLKGQQQIAPNLTTHEIPGLGCWLKDEHGSHWSLGKCGWDGMSDQPHNATASGCQLRQDGKEIASFHFAESLRHDAGETMQELADHAIYVLSGDQDERVQHISQSLKLRKNNIHSGLSPEDKARLVSEIDAEHSLFMGDGANDSLAFDAANMSGAVAGRGLLETKSDFYFLSSGLRFLPEMFRLARQHHAAVRAVFIFSILYNLSAIAVCLSGHMNPLLAAILMPLSSVISLAIIATSLMPKKRQNNSTTSIANENELS